MWVGEVQGMVSVLIGCRLPVVMHFFSEQLLLSPFFLLDRRDLNVWVAFCVLQGRDTSDPSILIQFPFWVGVPTVDNVGAL